MATLLCLPSERGLVDRYLVLGEGEWFQVDNQELYLCSDSSIARKKMTGWLAVEIPGNVIRPHDGDFTALFVSRSVGTINAIEEQVTIWNKAAKRVNELMSEEGALCPELGISPWSCCMCSNGTHYQP